MEETHDPREEEELEVDEEQADGTVQAAPAGHGQAMDSETAAKRQRVRQRVRLALLPPSPASLPCRPPPAPPDPPGRR